VAGGDHHARIEAELAGEEVQAGSGDDAQTGDVDPTAAQLTGQDCLEFRTAAPGITPNAHAMLGESRGETDHERFRDLLADHTPHPARAEQPVAEVVRQQ